MIPLNELFPEEACRRVNEWYWSYEPVAEKLQYRKLPPQKVKTVFYGDSITHYFPIQEFFPGISFLNRGIPGDSLTGLYLRLEDDIFPYQPEQVVMGAGINGISEENERMIAKFEALGNLISSRGIKVFFCSVLPLRHGDKWDRFQYQDKISVLNSMIRKLAEEKFSGYVDYHSALLDKNGELAEEYAKPDGTHVTLNGYCVMAEVLKNTVAL